MTIAAKFATISRKGRMMLWLAPNGARVDTPLAIWWLAWHATFGVDR